MEETDSMTLQHYEKNQSNFQTETLFTEMYRTMVKCMGAMVKADNDEKEKRLQGRYIHVLVNLSWGLVRVALSDDKLIKERDISFNQPITTVDQARTQIFELLKLGAEAGMMIRQDYGITDYDDMFTKRGMF